MALDPVTSESSSPHLPQLPRLGVNIDHVATLRQLRGTPYPNLIQAVDASVRGGAEQITIHLREDRRHIQDADVKTLRAHLERAYRDRILLNLEMSLAPEIVRIALQVRPHWVCLVPEKRQEVTTEGGLDLKRAQSKLKRVIPALQKKGIRVSLFIEPDLQTVQYAHILGADAIELHTGTYAVAAQKGKASAKKRELRRIAEAAALGQRLGLSVHAGHGLDAKNVRDLAFDLGILEFNIGHFLICRAVDVGLERAVREMVAAIRAP